LDKKSKSIQVKNQSLLRLLQSDSHVKSKDGPYD
jgi:hypothetical protein